MIFNQGYSIKIEQNRCFNQWHQGVECSHCIEHCPADAIFFYQNKIFLNKELCNGCGLCLSDCPTQVFSSAQWDEASIAGNVEEEGWKITEFFCENHTTPYKQHKSKDRGGVQLPACLSIVSKVAWYEIGLVTDIELHLEECEKCPMAKTLPRLQYNVTTAAEWLEDCGYNSKISTINQSVKGLANRKLEAIEMGLKVTSRRDLFLSLMGKGGQIMESINEEANPSSTKWEQKIPERCLPEWQKRLAKTYPQNQNNQSSTAYWPTIKINDQCVNCELCTKFCPSGTLQSATDNSICSRYFISGLCLDCRICQLFCPREAIRREREMIQYPFDTLNIYSANITECQHCESLTQESSRNLCYWCEEEYSMDDQLKEMCKKLLFD